MAVATSSGSGTQPGVSLPEPALRILRERIDELKARLGSPELAAQARQDRIRNFRGLDVPLRLRMQHPVIFHRLWKGKIAGADENVAGPHLLLAGKAVLECNRYSQALCALRALEDWVIDPRTRIALLLSHAKGSAWSSSLAERPESYILRSSPDSDIEIERFAKWLIRSVEDFSVLHFTHPGNPQYPSNYWDRLDRALQCELVAGAVLSGSQHLLPGNEQRSEGPRLNVYATGPNRQATWSANDGDAPGFPSPLPRCL